MTFPQEPLRGINDGLSVRRDSVIRLHEFQGDHPDVQFTSPVTGRYGQYTAVIPPSTIPGDPREIIVKSPDLCGLMDQLDDLSAFFVSVICVCRWKPAPVRKPSLRRISDPLVFQAFTRQEVRRKGSP